MKPIGYYVSVPEGHEDYDKLKDLEELYGSYFHRLSDRDLWAILNVCAQQSEKEICGKSDCYPKWHQLSGETVFDLIPFLHQVIKERIRNAN